MEQSIGKQNIRMALGVFIRTGVAAIISVFLSLSITMICTTVSTEEVGFTLWEFAEDATTVEAITDYVYTDEAEKVGTLSFVFDENNNVIRRTEFIARDHVDDPEMTDTMQRTKLYSDIPANVALIGNIVTLIASLIILGAVPYRYLWEQGNLDRNAVNFGHQYENKWRGAQIGLIANIPSIAVYLLLWAGKLGIWLSDMATQIYVLFNSSFSAVTIWTIGDSVTDATTISVGQMLILAIPVLALPVICQFAYFMGRKEILISDKLMLKSNKKKSKKRKG